MSACVLSYARACVRAGIGRAGRRARNASKTGTVSTKAAQKAAWAAVDTTKGMSFEAAKRKAMQEKQVEEDSKVCLNCSS